LPGGVEVSVLVTEPKGRVFEPSQGDGFLKAIKIRSTPSFEWEVKPEVPCRKILRYVKNPFKSLSLTGTNRLNSHFLRPFSYSADRTARALVAARALW
jgi:hypothetical protein